MGQVTLLNRLRETVLLASRLAVLLMLGGQEAHAGIRHWLEGIVSDRIEYTINVRDSRGRPVEGATVWLMGDDADRQDVKADDLARLVRRYSADADLVFTRNLHPNLLVLRTDSAGNAKLEYEESDIGSLKSLTSHFAAIKRGFQPAILSDLASAGAKRQVKLVLEKAKGAEPLQAMEEFDRLRAVTEHVADNRVDERTGAELDALNSRIRRIATALEANGNADDAAVVYYNLAYLASVDITKDADGNIVSRGYTHGFDARSPARVADRKKAWALNKSHPWLEFQSLRDKLEERDPKFFSDKTSVGRRTFIAESERLIREHGERMWPDVYTFLWRSYNAEGDFPAGCRALQRYYAFEPTVFTVREWHSLLRSFDADVQLRGGDLKCVIPQLPAEPVPR